MGTYDPKPITGATGWDSWLNNAVQSLDDRAAVVDAGGGGTSDDTATVQAALNAVNTAGGGVLKLRPHTTYTCLDLAWPGSNVIIAGDGPSSILKMKAGTADNHNLIAALGTTTDTSGNLTNIGMRNCQLLGTVTTDAFVQHRHLLALGGVSGARFDNVLFKGFQGDGAYLGHTGGNERHNENIRFQGCTFDGVNQDNRNCISIIDGTDIGIVGNEFMNSTRTDMPGAIDIEPNSGFTWAVLKSISIVGNTFRNIRAGIAGIVGLVLWNTQAAYTTPMTGLLVAGNTFVDSPSALATFFAQQPQTPTVTTRRNNIAFIANTAYNSGEPFEISGIRGMRVANNQFETCWNGANIGYTNECHDILVSGNAFDGVSGSNGITIYKAQRLAITENDFINAATNVLRFGVGTGSVGNSDKVDFLWNRIKGTSATAVLLKDAAHTVTSTANNRCVGNILNGLATTLTSVFAAGGSNTALNL